MNVEGDKHCGDRRPDASTDDEIADEEAQCGAAVEQAGAGRGSTQLVAGQKTSATSSTALKATTMWLRRPAVDLGSPGTEGSKRPEVARAPRSRSHRSRQRRWPRVVPRR